MAAIFLTNDTRDQIVQRLEKIGADTSRKWGVMQPIEMIAHLRRAFEISLGEVEVRDESNFVVRNVLGPIAFSGLLPWPKGKLKTLPVFLATPEGDIEEEKTKLVAAVDRFVEASEKEPEKKALSPAFGWLTLGYWRKVHGIHTDHHLRQFGV